MEGLSAFERAVLDKLLAGNHPVLASLRRQAADAELIRRERTGVGFYCHFAIPLDIPAAPVATDFTIGDVTAAVDGLAHGAGFMLFVEDGRISLLEGFSYDEPWPSEVGGYRLTYISEPRELELPPAG
jgi:hypothetical protein